MHLPTDVLLSDCDATDGPRQLVAVIDELTLTYTIVEHNADGQTRRLRQHVPTLRDARRWAGAYLPDKGRKRPAADDAKWS
jgi:hypothetical protein